jgi:glycine betaine/proline transport system substrate-binding protein
MKKITESFRSLLTAVAVLGLLTVGLAGCGGGSSSGDQGVSRQMDMVTVNWIEGMALTYAQEAILEDSLNMEVDVREAPKGVAFKSVASGDRDYFNEAWLPTTHSDIWGQIEQDAQKLGYTYKGTSAGLAVPAYVDINSVTELPQIREELDGKINGIGAGATVNKQARQILDNNNIEGFEIVASSGPATWQEMETAISNDEPIVVTGWYPHWKWGSYDLKYLESAQTGQTPVFGEAEDVFKIVGNDFVETFPKETVCFLKHMEVNDEQIETLMAAFRNRGDMDKKEAAAQWVANHPEWVSEWMSQAEECAASDGAVEYLPDDAVYSRDQSEGGNV